METKPDATYPPLNTLKAIADDVWIVDGPLIRFGMPWPKFSFPTRMTLIRVGRDDLFIHSPTPLPDTLKTQVTAIGNPRWIIGPNRIHYWWIPDWHAAFPQAQVYLAPRIKENSRGRIDFGTLALDRDSGYPWDSEIATLAITGSFMTEVVFFHHASRTLVLTDLIENFEREKLTSPLMRWLTKWARVQHPDGQMPRDMRLTYSKTKPQLRAAIEMMIGWNPERVILAHGRWYDHNGTQELRRAFRWLSV
jgi:Domain of unknown function (DUF4336)